MDEISLRDEPAFHLPEFFGKGLVVQTSTVEVFYVKDSICEELPRKLNWNALLD